ncbi:MAG: ribosome silencing factor [Oscillospiraceae bacterium]|nr:ribosome silencing factor [Oscillospiraceae bacterium]
MDVKNMVEVAVRALDAKIAADINVLKIEEISTLSEYFIICTGTSNTHVGALRDAIEQKFDELDIPPHHVEGHSGAWVLMDYGSIVIHIFTEEGRRFYQLDKVWADATPIPVSDMLSE